jgi:3-oxoacyl-[acyl-carrier-protein] synthase II
MALHEAGLEPGANELGDAGVALATAFGPAGHTQRLLDQILDSGPRAASPALFTECVANAPAAQIAIQAGLRGANHTLSAREAGSLIALGHAASAIRAQRAEIVLAGAVEEITPLLHSLIDRFRALARERHGLAERPRPFDRRRDGYIAAEGACVLVLETREAARRRRAVPLVTVRAWGRAFDPTASRAGWGEGAAALARSLRAILRRHAVELHSIDAVVSGASGSVAGDRLEARLLDALWDGERLPPIVAPKAITGEHGGGFLAAAVLTASGATVPAAPAEPFERDPELAIVPAARSALDGARRFLVTSLAAGGAAAWVVLERA